MRRWPRWFSPLAAALLVATACDGGAGRASAPERFTSISFGELPSVVVEHGDYMWALDRRGGGLAKIDPDTNDVVDTFLASQRPIDGFWGLVPGRDALWLTRPRAKQLVGFDPSSGKITESVEMDSHVSDAFYAFASLWVIEGRDLVRIHPNARTPRIRIPLRRGLSLTDVVEYGGSIWIGTSSARYFGGAPGPNPTHVMTSELWRIDPDRNIVTDTISLGSTFARGPVNPVVGDLEVADGGLWMSRPYENRILLLDPDSGEILLQFPIAAFEVTWEFAVVDDDLWVGDLNANQVMWIDPDTRERELFELDQETSYVGGGFGSAWLPVGGGIIRLDPPN